MQRGNHIQMSHTPAICIECIEQPIRSCALCQTPLCKHHQHKIYEEDTPGMATVVLCSFCESQRAGSSLDELCTYINWYYPGWALA